MSLRCIDERTVLPGCSAGAPGTLHGPAVTMRTGVDNSSPSVLPHGMAPWINCVADKHAMEETRMRNVLNDPYFPTEIAMTILKHAGEAGNADQVFWFVAKECKRKAPWLDCSKDDTWRELAIAVFGGPRANIDDIDRWKRENDALRATAHLEPLGWADHFYWLFWAYSSMKARVRDPSKRFLREVPGDRFMAAVFPRFHEFPFVWVGTEKFRCPGTDCKQARPYLRLK